MYRQHIYSIPQSFHRVNDPGLDQEWPRGKYLWSLFPYLLATVPTLNALMSSLNPFLTLSPNLRENDMERLFLKHRARSCEKYHNKYPLLEIKGMGENQKEMDCAENQDENKSENVTRTFKRDVYSKFTVSFLLSCLVSSCSFEVCHPAEMGKRKEVSSSENHVRPKCIEMHQLLSWTNITLWRALISYMSSWRTTGKDID